MQVLFSRLAQARQPQCRACNHAVHGLGRRATTAAKRRKPTFADVFTACYSSMFASAAVLDAVRKDDRRQELDRQIDETKRELVELQEGQLEDHWDRSKERKRTWRARNRWPERSKLDDIDQALERCSEKPPVGLTIEQMDSVYQAMREICSTRPFMKEVKSPMFPSSDPLLRDLQQRQYGSLGDAAVAGLGKIDYEALIEGLRAEEFDDRIVQHKIESEAHIRSASRRTMALIKALLFQAGDYSKGEWASPHSTLEQLRNLIMQKGYPHYSAPGSHPDHEDQMAQLHESFRVAIGNPELDLREQVARVCHNLALSPVTPNMHTFNTLMVYFNRAGHHHLAEEVAFSFQHRQRLIPTPLTHVILLSHYKEAGNPGRFLQVMRTMAGADPFGGPKVDRQRVKYVHARPGLEHIARDERRWTRQGEFYFEHVPISTALVETMLQGLLHFRLFDAAALLFSTCLQSGVNLGKRAVKHVLEAIVQSLDYKASERLATGLIHDDYVLCGLLEGVDEATRLYYMDRVVALLEVCGILAPDRSFADASLATRSVDPMRLQRLLVFFRDVGGEALTSGLRFAPSGPKSVLLQMESLRLELASVRRTVTSLERKLIRLELPEIALPIASLLGTGAIRKAQQLVEEFSEMHEELNLPQLHLAQPDSKGASSTNPLWSCDTGVFIDDTMKHHVMRQAQRILGLGEPLPLYANKELGWLKEWEQRNQGDVTWTHRRKVGWYWEPERHRHMRRNKRPQAEQWEASAEPEKSMAKQEDAMPGDPYVWEKTVVFPRPDGRRHDGTTDGIIDETGPPRIGEGRPAERGADEALAVADEAKEETGHEGFKDQARPVVSGQETERARPGPVSDKGIIVHRRRWTPAVYEEAGLGV